MKITIITAALSAGGAERVIAQLLKEWCKNGIECSLILLNKTYRFYEIPENVVLREIGQLSSNHYKDKFLKYKKVRQMVNTLQPDVVLSLPEEIGIYVIGALLGTHIPVVVSERNNPWVMPYKKETRFLRRMLYPFAAGLIFQTKGAASFFSRQIQDKGIILPNPLDFSRIPEPYEGEREKRIVSVGRLEKQKNFPLLIEAFEKFSTSHSEYTLTIYGEGSERKNLEKLIRQKGMEAKINLPGRDQNVLEKIRKAAVFALSSDYEGVPNALIEALAMGLPCVSTDCAPGGARELIQNEENGYIVPVQDSEKLCERITELCDNQDISKAFSKKALKIKERYNSAWVANDWIIEINKLRNRRNHEK